MDNEKTVGMILKEARQSRGLSLADIEKATSIRSLYLEAVENDEYDKTPGEVFLKGIIRTYGNFLQLDGPALVDAYKASAAGMAAEAVQSKAIREVEKVRLNIQLKDKRDIGSGTGRFELPKLPVKQCLAGLAAVAVLAAGYFAVPAAIDYAKSLPKETPKEAEQAKPQETTTAAPVAPLDKVTVDMEAQGDCWLEVSADGKEVFSGMLQAKDKKSFEAKDKLVVKYGNIGVVQIKVDGKPIDLKGEHGVAVKTYMRANSAADAAVPAAEAGGKKQAAPRMSESKAASPRSVQPAAAPEKAAEPAPAGEQQVNAAKTAAESKKK